MQMWNNLKITQPLKWDYYANQSTQPIIKNVNWTSLKIKNENKATDYVLFSIVKLIKFRRYRWKLLAWFQHLKECNRHRHDCVLFLHKHGSKFDEIAVLWILHFNDSPWVHTTSHLTTFDLYDLVWSNHCEWHSSLRKKWNTIHIIKIESIHQLENA